MDGLNPALHLCFGNGRKNVKDMEFLKSCFTTLPVCFVTGYVTLSGLHYCIRCADKVLKERTYRPGYVNCDEQSVSMNHYHFFCLEKLQPFLADKFCFNCDNTLMEFTGCYIKPNECWLSDDGLVELENYKMRIVAHFTNWSEQNTFPTFDHDKIFGEKKAYVVYPVHTSM